VEVLAFQTVGESQVAGLLAGLVQWLDGGSVTVRGWFENPAIVLLVSYDGCAMPL
jgi:hypothetical protein